MTPYIYKRAFQTGLSTAETMWNKAKETGNYVTDLGETKTLAPDQYRATTDPAWQKKNPAETALLRYREAMPENDLAYSAGEYIRNKMVGNPTGAPGSSGFLGTGNAMTGAVAMGLPAALLGLGGGYLADKLSDDPESNWASRGAIAAGVLGAGLGAYSGAWRNKSGAYLDPKVKLEAILNNLPGLSYQQRDIFIAGVSQLSDQQVRSLLQTIMASGGVGIGAIIAKFLLNAGLGGTIIGGLAGGLIGNALAPGPPKDALGRNSTNHKDLFGNPFYYV